MIAQWENKCISLSYPLCVPGYDSSVGERMHLTVCALCVSGHDSSVGERMHLTICPLGSQVEQLRPKCVNYYCARVPVVSLYKLHKCK